MSRDHRSTSSSDYHVQLSLDEDIPATPPGLRPHYSFLPHRFFSISSHPSSSFETHSHQVQYHDQRIFIRWIRRLGSSIPQRFVSISIILVAFFITLWFLISSVGDRAKLIRAPSYLRGGRLFGAHPDYSDERLGGECDPFLEPGYLNFDPSNPINNTWIPFDPSRCDRSSLLKPLLDDLQSFYRSPSVDYRTHLDRALPWLVNRTVVLIGDSIERFHARDFCDLLSALVEPPFHNISQNGFSPSQSSDLTPSQSFFVGSSSPLKPNHRWYFDPTNHSAIPPDWPKDDHQNYLDHHLQWADRENIRTSPWICEVPSYGFRIVTLFSFGVEPHLAGWHYSKHDWFITPSSFIDKFHHILLPILRNLSEQRQSPKILEPDLIEVSSGLWDLRQWSEEDSRIANITLDDSSELVYLPLGRDRLDWWKERVIKLLLAIDHAFSTHHDSGESARSISSQSTILWRTLHHPARHAVAPYSRVEQLDQFARFMIQNIQTSDDRQLSRLASRLRIDSWGRKMLGQENHLRDAVHPQAIPGSILWSEMMLWQLRASIMKKEKAS